MVGFWKMPQKLKTQVFVVMFCPKSWADYYTLVYLHPLGAGGADEFGGCSWQLITALHDAGHDGVTQCGQLTLSLSLTLMRVVTCEFNSLSL